MNIFKIRPRFRIYSNLKDYFTVYKAILLKNITKGNDCELFEDRIVEFMDSGYGVCMPQGRVAIYLAIRSIIKPGQNVILSPYTIADVINMVICAGAIPVFADIERVSCNIDPHKIEALIDENTGAIMITHLHGLACNMSLIQGICEKYNIPLIEDAAQAFGATYNGKRIGSFGIIGAFSFGMYKNITAFYGGMLITSNKEIANKVSEEIQGFPYSELSWYHKKILKGIITDISTSFPLFQILVFWIFRFGHLKKIKFINKFVETELDLDSKKVIPESYLRKMTPLQARIALTKLKQVDEDNNKRIRFAKMYYEGLKDIAQLFLPPLKTDGSHIYTYFPIQYNNRQELIRWMIKNNCDVGPQHLKNTADLPAFKIYYMDCPNARKIADEVILLPSYPKYTFIMARHNIKVINHYFSRLNNDTS